MELPRVLLLSALFLVAFMLWNAWENEYVRPLEVVTKAQVAQPGQTVTSLPPAQTSQAVPAVSSQAIASGEAPPSPLAPSSHFIHVETDVLDIAIDPQGGNIVDAHLLKYPESITDKKSQPVQLLSNDVKNWYVAQSGLLGKEGPDTKEGQGLYSTTKTNYQMDPAQNTLSVDLVWKNRQGVSVHKQFIFNRGSYQIGLQYQIENHSRAPWTGQFYAQLQRVKPTPPSRGLFSVNPYVGGAISSAAEPYEKISFAKMTQQNVDRKIQGGWAAMLQHYFLSAWIPNSSDSFNYYSEANGNDIYTLGFIGQPITTVAGGQSSVGAKLYVGPELLEQLNAAAPHLNLTVDYGLLWFASMAIFWVMKHIYSVVGNWGWSIVMVTVFIKLAFYHLSAKSYRSMALMRKLQPRIQAIRERYANDKQKMTQATMELYRNEKINPLGGCLPIVVQIPVFIALYWVLLESVQLRQAPFIFWIHDLSLKDPYYVLPVLMGLSMLVQQLLNPPPPDPAQAKMMMFLPVIFTFLFLNFPSGLVLYWLVNNTLSILQQWFIMKTVDTSDSKRKK